jgi:LPXTG-motif cell wall-anchored protein
MKFRRHSVAVATTVMVAAAAVALSPSSPAGAVGAVFGLDYYISAPMVQGTHVSGAVKENFNSAGTCSGTIGTGGAITVGGANCTLESSPNDYGGASVDTATPTAGGAGSGFPVADEETGTLFSLTSQQCYLGLYWTAGSGGNLIEFYSEGELVLTLESSDITAILESSEPTLESVGGTTYQKDSWFGNPRGHTDSSSDGIPDGSSTLNDGEPYVYLNVYGKGGLTFDAVRFSGPNFEFDNLAFSSSCQTPPSSSVYLGFVGEGEPERAPSFDYDDYDPQYLHRQLPDSEALPNTGRDVQALVWAALALTGGGLTFVAGRRRLVSR